MIIDITTKKGYDLACGLRGGDGLHYIFKWVGTCRIRSLVGVDGRHHTLGGYRERRLSRGNLDTFILAITRLRKEPVNQVRGGAHFCFHVALAFSALSHLSIENDLHWATELEDMERVFRLCVNYLDDEKENCKYLYDQLLTLVHIG